LALGFDRAGVARLTVTRESAFSATGSARHHGEMAYLARNVAARVDPSTLFEGARSALVVALVYAHPERDERSRPQARIARYAGGDDYHDVMLGRLRAVGDALEALAGRACAGAPTWTRGPVLERVLAAHAGSAGSARTAA